MILHHCLSSFIIESFLSLDHENQLFFCGNSFPGLRHESLIRLLVVPGQYYVFATAYSQLDCICKRAFIKDEGRVIMPCKCNKDENS